MCCTKKELESKVQELRNLRTMKVELEDELKAVEREIVSYKPQSRITLDKDKLKEIFGEDLKPFEKVSIFNVLRIK